MSNFVRMEVAHEDPATGVGNFTWAQLFWQNHLQKQEQLSLTPRMIIFLFALCTLHTISLALLLLQQFDYGGAQD